MTDIIEALRHSQGDAQTRCRAIEEIERLRAEKTPDLSGLFSLLRHMTCSDEVNTQKWARELGKELTKMGVKR